MKNLIVIIISMLAGSLYSQMNISEEIVSMSKGTNSAYTFILEETPKKIAVDIWESHMKSYKGKTKSSKTETLTDNAKMPNLSSNTVDVYANFLELSSEQGTKVTVWIDLGGAYMSSETHVEKQGAADQFFNAFGKKVNVFRASEYLEGQQKSLKDLEKEWTKLLKDKESYLKKIEDAKSLIAKNEDLVKKNQEEQEAKVVEIDSQKKNVADAKNALQKVQ